ncbi:ceramidase [Synchytrium microbalum]|uniref:Neutral ceramidase n=1 Tax=Synchytrium microbalum TaxID=1806994 RepID=A0A507CDD5_9FUNG|nr:ceramidase [Synchytrium microbalum]TPX35934.1 ceramidase [Synchytrium microbalum]
MGVAKGDYILVPNDDHQPIAPSKRNHQTITLTVLTALALLGVLIVVNCNTHRYDLFILDLINHRKESTYAIGVGKYDATGPIAGVNMMGYAQTNQTTHGIHQRLYARAFIIYDTVSNRRVAIVNLDAGMSGAGVKRMAVARLQEEYGDVYRDDNVMISGTHTHSGPAGFLQYVLYQITSLGVVDQTLHAMVDGIVGAIARAHENLEPGTIRVAFGHVYNASINRSPAAYDNNPEAERALYASRVDTDMTLLRFDSISGTPLGILTWFAVHCTSMNNTNELVSGDNKGYAAYLMEREMGNGFVAGFMQSNMGDVSPNTEGPKCLDTGLECDSVSSTCDGRNEMCVARGPGWRIGDFESTRIIGDLQYRAAHELFHNTSISVHGAVESRLKYIDMTSVSLEVDGQQVKTCKAAMGFSFAAGTTDGTGAFNFIQGDNGTISHPFWNVVKGFVTKKPSQEQVDCHAPKPILLDTGESTRPYAWQPSIVDVQVFKVGNVVLLGVPAEFTTMAGRRARQSVKDTLNTHGVLSEDGVVILTGPAGSYSSYVTTFEEYQVQRYEGASTIFGPHTLSAYIHHLNEMATSLVPGSPLLDKGLPVPDLIAEAIRLQPGVVYDGAPIGVQFGDVKQDISPSSRKIVAGVGGHHGRGVTVSAVFWAGHPRNDLMTEGTYLTVDRLEKDDRWSMYRTDNDWDTRLKWEQTGASVLGWNLATVTWDVGSDVEVGTYRLHYYGFHKQFGSGKILPHEGISSAFEVVPNL